MTKNSISRLIIALAVIFSLPSLSQTVSGQVNVSSLLDNVHYRSIGPTRAGGRYVDFAVVNSNPTTFYAALATGGLWKTDNGGTTFTEIFGEAGAISIGDIAVDQNNNSILWVGTGEANNSRTAYYGDGVYKSTDGGKTWSNTGLKNSQHIGRIIIHPSDGNTVWVAAEGPLYSEGGDRGIYKTTNGGRTWKKVLEVQSHGKEIGFVDLAIDPTNPDILYAAAYDKVRRPWTFNAGGPGSGIYKSTNGGRDWTKLADGLPCCMLGRIGIAVSPSHPNIVYANIENNNIEGVSDEERHNQLLNGIPPEGREMGDEMYRSDDHGNTWRKVSPDGEDVGGGPAYYYQQMCIDPADPDHVYVLGVRMWETVNGGAEWRQPFRFGGDNHCMWIDPDNSRHMMLGYDHGMGITRDAGVSWYHPDFKDVGQFVAVGFDMDYPYNVYGRMQDNGSAKGPSTLPGGGAITLEKWQSTGGGDGMYNVVDYTDSRWLYNESQFGPISRTDQLTGERAGIRYSDMDRWAWNAPIVLSPHNPAVLYHAGNRVVKSVNRGDSWEVISDDLTTNDEAKIQGTGNIQYCTIVTMDESPVTPGLLWVGTDDGKVWVTRDDGKNWDDVTENIPGHPGYWVSRVEPSSAVAGRAYVTITGYRNDDFRPFVWKTEDYAKSWSSISANLPDEPLCVIREHPDNGNLLFAGTTKSVFVSIDGGTVWNRMKNNMPYVPVEDLKIHPRENELIVATHGRSIWIADISYLTGLDGAVKGEDAFLFEPVDGVQWVAGGNYNSAYANFNGESRREGIPFYYFLGRETSDVVLEVLDGERVIYTIKGESTPGVHAASWNYDKILRERTPREKEQLERQLTMYRNYGLTDADIEARMGPMDYITGKVNPGSFTLRLKAGNQVLTRSFTVLKDHWFMTR
jgi:photosystem II stability/assembly factor-like uncharacterized protein